MYLYRWTIAQTSLPLRRLAKNTLLVQTRVQRESLGNQAIQAARHNNSRTSYNTLPKRDTIEVCAAPSRKLSLRRFSPLTLPLEFRCINADPGSSVNSLRTWQPTSSGAPIIDLVWTILFQINTIYPGSKACLQRQGSDQGHQQIWTMWMTGIISPSQA